MFIDTSNFGLASGGFQPCRSPAVAGVESIMAVDCAGCVRLHDRQTCEGIGIDAIAALAVS
jgi:hypothetical protein